MFIGIIILILTIAYIWGRRVIGISGSLIWSKTLMELTFISISSISIYLLSNLVELRPCGLLFHSTRL